MEKIKNKFSFDRAVHAFGAWNTWSRWEHIAYGLIRGVPYFAMEKYCNDAPDHHSIQGALLKLGAWPEYYAFDKEVPVPRLDWNVISKLITEVRPLVVWVRKPVRGPRIRPSNLVPAEAAAEE